ncbi:cytochrome P450 [Lophiostoma macrostomum CBS 122681]|uniref:Cytochrome P450 n=1 Tax=Lophiostoma macrostomum CBS 122681 TaxID=1314788 RepID=A0A6A6TBJ6_9PLEO|nr:cytochrome P450 [Lophiostoma macrostomum CBS 122681]
MVWATAFTTVLLPLLGYLVRKTYHHRSTINALRKQGIAMPPGWSWVTGHLLILQKYVDQLPSNANVNLAMADLAREFSDTEVFLMDFWPVYQPLLMVYDPDAAGQITAKYNLPKTDMHLHFMKPITGGPNLISMSDQEWKLWRSLFNPGFSTAALTETVPHIVKSVEIFREKLMEKAYAGITCLDDLTTRLTMDVIMKITLDADLNYQHSENRLASALGHITRWHSFWDPRILLHPLRPIIQKYYGRVMDNLIRKELDQRYFELRTGKFARSDDNAGKMRTAKSVVTLAIEAYMTQNQHTDLLQKPQLEEHFARYATHQVRLFLFAGNDTTSSTIMYAYHLLSQHPNALQIMRKEHDKVFGSNTDRASDLLAKQPALLNQCKYTMAVIKETLRLYPPAGTMRAGQPGISLNDRHGNKYPMDDIGAIILHPAVHRNPRVWPRPNEFLPERFLVDPDHELFPYAPAFRPFEQGPRNCIGQTLVYNEIRVALILTLRTFDISPAYDEWDTVKTQQASWFKRFKTRVFGQPVQTVHGDRAYQTEKAGTHPADGYPCRITLAK